MNYLFKTILVSGLILAVISGCGNDQNYDKEAANSALDLSGRDTTANAASNFFEYANGTWLKETDIPPSKTGWGSFYVVRDNALANMRTILDSVSALNNMEQGSIEQQIGDLYASGMDSAATEKAGIKPLKNELDRIASLKSIDAVIPQVVRQYKNGEGTLFSFYVAPDDKSSMVQRAHFNQGGLGLPSRGYYFRNDEKSKQIRSAYKDYITNILTLSGSSKNTASSQAQSIIELETKLAEKSKTPVELRNPQANYHLLSVSKMNDKTQNIDWSKVVEQMELGVDTLQVGQPEFYKRVSSLIESTPLGTWKSYLQFHLISSHANWLSSPYADAYFDFYNKTLNGQKQQQARWKRVSGLVDNTLGDALGELYVGRYFPPEAKDYMRGLVDNLQSTYRKRIKNLEWMTDSTKTQALEKLDAFAKKIGYPNSWEDYSSITIDSTALVSNLEQIGQWQYQDMIDKLGKPVDRSEWGMTAPTVNAYYNPSFNEIVFPAGILQPPFYYQGADDAVNYGAIGAVIGHEMTHGFDDQGSQYDKVGNLKSWWSEQDRKQFEKRTQQVVDQYNAYTVLDTVHVNGELTLGENIADIGGLAIAFDAFENTDQFKNGEKINGLTPTQRFFMAFAQVWRIKNTDERLRFRINNDPHSPERYRVEGPLSNMPAFYEAFNVSPSDSMHRADSVRVAIW